MTQTQTERLLSAIRAGITSFVSTWKTTNQDSVQEQPSSTLSTTQSKSKPDESTGPQATSTALSVPTSPLTELVEVSPEALFIYFRNYIGQPSPQIIYDIEMFEYQVESGKIPVIQRHKIRLAEAALGIDELMKLYPCVRHTDDNAG
jgi:hypothetical protein